MKASARDSTGGAGAKRRPPPRTAPNLLERIYDRLSDPVESFAVRFDEVLKTDPDPIQLGAAYGAAAARPLRLMSLLSANVRLYAIFFACIGGIHGCIGGSRSSL